MVNSTKLFKTAFRFFQLHLRTTIKWLNPGYSWVLKQDNDFKQISKLFLKLIQQNESIKSSDLNPAENVQTIPKRQVKPTNE